jgi:hypothetical protein
MKKIGQCKDQKGTVTDLFEEGGKYYRTNPPVYPRYKGWIETADGKRIDFKTNTLTSAYRDLFVKNKTLAAKARKAKMIHLESNEDYFDKTGPEMQKFLKGIKMNPGKYPHTGYDYAGGKKRRIRAKTISDAMSKGLGRPLAYCMKCKKNIVVKDGKITTTKNKTKMMKGVCPACETKVARIMGKY